MQVEKTTTAMGTAMEPAKAEVSFVKVPIGSGLAVEALQCRINRIGPFEAMRCIQT
jgi:hypothetical protein